MLLFILVMAIIVLIVLVITRINGSGGDELRALNLWIVILVFVTVVTGTSLAILNRMEPKTETVTTITDRIDINGSGENYTLRFSSPVIVDETTYSYSIWGLKETRIEIVITDYKE